MEKSLLNDLIDRLWEFADQQEAENRNMKAFARWLADSYGLLPPTLEKTNPTVGRAGPYAETPDSVLSKYIVYMNRYARMYIRKALEGTPLSTGDDFTYLIAVMQSPGLTKSALIALNLHEKPTGMEIIRRLLQKGLLQQSEAQADRRSKRLYLTETGKGALFQAFGRMGKVAEVVGGDLSDAEKEVLTRLLARLDAFHRPVFFQEPGTPSLADLLGLKEDQDE